MGDLSLLGRFIAVLNAVSVLAALVVSFVVGAFSSDAARSPPGPALAESPLSGGVNSKLKVDRRASGEIGALRDATGALVPIRPYRRVAGGSLVADRLLLELLEPARVVAALDSSRKLGWGHQIAAPHTITDPTDAERLLQLAPDLVLLSDLGEGQKFERLRELGVNVFVLGPMHGTTTLLPQVRAAGVLLGESERAEKLIARLETRIRVLKAAAPPARPTALYLGVYGDKIYGGTRNTSYGDVLSLAGLEDVASRRYTGWPKYAPEDILALNPDYLVGSRGTSAVCALPGLYQISACRAGRVVELDQVLLTDPGPGVLDAAEALFERVHGNRRKPSPPPLTSSTP